MIWLIGYLCVGAGVGLERMITELVSDAPAPVQLILLLGIAVLFVWPVASFIRLFEVRKRR